MDHLPDDAHVSEPPFITPRIIDCLPSAIFTLQHALDCKTGGLVIQQHNEVRDCLGDMAAQVWSQVVREPIPG